VRIKQFAARLRLLNEDEGGRRKPILGQYSGIIRFTGNRWDYGASLSIQRELWPGNERDVTVVVFAGVPPKFVRPGVRFTLREGERITASGVVRDSPESGARRE
jgi:translation elongation factor EF-Tu-like GTPase